MEKKILDVTCGSRTIWFDKNHPAALYCDKRKETYQGYWKSGDCKSTRNCIVDPDVVCDFTALPFPDNSFPLVVFDPPHLTRAKDTAWLVKKYGKLDDTWPHMLHEGFAECMRVLKPDGVLIFKWSEYDIPAEKVWKAIGQKPLFGHHSGKQSRTFWGCFMKLVDVSEKFDAGAYKDAYVDAEGIIRTNIGSLMNADRVCELINHPDRIVRKPRWTEKEVEEAKTFCRMWPGGEIEFKRYADGRCAMIHIQGSLHGCLDLGQVDLFPSLRPGETVKLDEIIGGAQ